MLRRPREIVARVQLFVFSSLRVALDMEPPLEQPLKTALSVAGDRNNPSPIDVSYVWTRRTHDAKLYRSQIMIAHAI